MVPGLLANWTESTTLNTFPSRAQMEILRELLCQFDRKSIVIINYFTFTHIREKELLEWIQVIFLPHSPRRGNAELSIFKWELPTTPKTTGNNRILGESYTMFQTYVGLTNNF